MDFIYRSICLIEADMLLLEDEASFYGEGTSILDFTVFYSVLFEFLFSSITDTNIFHLKLQRFISLQLPICLKLKAKRKKYSWDCNFHFTKSLYFLFLADICRKTYMNSKFINAIIAGIFKIVSWLSKNQVLQNQARLFSI